MGGLNRWGIQTAENWGILDRRLQSHTITTKTISAESPLLSADNQLFSALYGEAETIRMLVKKVANFDQ